jgi:peptidoglycan hydrolase CwlO-like protein
MPCNSAPTTEHLIREIRELARLFEELTDSVHEIHAELTQLQEQLGINEIRIKERLVARAFRARTNKPN